jgi:hypothetical protein
MATPRKPSTRLSNYEANLKRVRTVLPATEAGDDAREALGNLEEFIVHLVNVLKSMEYIGFGPTDES